MPTIHYASRKFLSRHGVNNLPPRTKNQTSTVSNNAQHQFLLPLASFASSGGDNNVSLLSIIANSRSNIHRDGPSIHDCDRDDE